MATALLAAAAVPAAADDFAPRTIRDRVLPHDPRLPVPVLEGPAVAVAGERRAIRWRTPGPEVEELELLLSLDDGRRFVLRVSPELHGAENHYEWQVPNLASAHARLRLRMRIAGREIESDIGEPFVIEADLGRPIERDLVHEGTWWTGPGSGSGDAACGFDAGAPAPGLAAASAPAACDAPARVLAQAARAPRAPHAVTAAANGTAPARAGAVFRSPRRSPLRA